MPNPNPPADPPVNPPAGGTDPVRPPAAPVDEGTKRRDEVKSILAELAQSGEIFGGAPEGGTSPPESGSSVDLETAIGRVLERRETESKAREKQQEQEITLADLKEKVGKGLGRVRRWFEPASPWGD